MQQSVYQKPKGEARITFCAFRRGKEIVTIVAPTWEAMQERLRQLCPSGTFRDLWKEARTC